MSPVRFVGEVNHLRPGGDPGNDPLHGADEPVVQAEVGGECNGPHALDSRLPGTDATVLPGSTPSRQPTSVARPPGPLCAQTITFRVGADLPYGKGHNLCTRNLPPGNQRTRISLHPQIL